MINSKTINKMDTINNCNELLAYLANEEFFCGNHKYSCGGYLKFQDNICEVGGFMPDRWCTLMPSTKFPRTVFAINDDYENDGQFILYVYHGEYFILDQTLAIKLPNYVKDELMATIKGYNY